MPPKIQQGTTPRRVNPPNQAVTIAGIPFPLLKENTDRDFAHDPRRALLGPYFNVRT